MARYFRFPWATGGDRTNIPDDTQSGGAVSYNEGYGIAYQQDPATVPTARTIERQMYNQALFDVTSTLQLYYQTGVPPFITSANNGGTAFSYPIRARVLFDPGSGPRIYESTQASNNQPPTVTTHWRIADLDGIAALGQVIGSLSFQTTNTPAPGYFALDGSTVMNARTDYPALFNSGSRFITPSGNNIVLHNAVDFIRGRGNSSRAVGSLQTDATRNATGEIGTVTVGSSPANVTRTGVFSDTPVAANGSRTNVTNVPTLGTRFDLSNMVPTADEIRPRSLTSLICIYHGVL